MEQGKSGIHRVNRVKITDIEINRHQIQSQFPLTTMSPGTCCLTLPNLNIHIYNVRILHYLSGGTVVGINHIRHVKPLNEYCLINFQYLVTTIVLNKGSRSMLLFEMRFCLHPKWKFSEPIIIFFFYLQTASGVTANNRERNSHASIIIYLQNYPN